jgi:hypothetical protein
MSTVAYFIKNVSINLFRERGIPVLEGMVGNSYGIIFPVEFRERALEAINWNSREIKEVPTSEWSVNELLQDEGIATPPACVIYHNEPSDHWREYLDIVANFCNDLRMVLPVVLHYSYSGHGLYENGAIHICFGGSAYYRVKICMFSRDIFYQRLHIWIGELGPEHQNCRDLIPTILREFLPRVIGAVNEINTESFAGDCARWIQEEREALESRLQETRHAIEALQKKIVLYIRHEESLQQMIGQGESAVGEEVNSLNAVIEEIRNRSYVHHVQYIDTNLYIHTERIIIDLNGTFYDIGEFVILIPINGGDIRMFNKTRKISSELVGVATNHPHVDKIGRPCLGTIKEVVARYIAKREFVALTDILYNYLKNVNPDDAWGRTIERWPHFGASN